MKNWQFGVICVLIILSAVVIDNSITSKFNRYNLYELEQRVQLIDTNIKIVNKNLDVLDEHIKRIKPNRFD